VSRRDYKILHCADLHLDSPLRGLEAYADAPLTRIRDATQGALTNMVEFAIAEEVAVVLIAGDIYDGDHKDIRTRKFFLAALKRLVDAGIEVVAISGNHDADNVLVNDHKTAWPQGEKAGAAMLRTDRVETKAFEHLNLAIHGRGYSKRTATADLNLYPEPYPNWLNIGLLHTSADGQSDDHAEYASCSYEAMASLGYDYWALGHVHTRRIERRGDRLMVFPGNLQGRHIREAGERGASLITVRNGRIAGAPEHHNFDVVRWEKIECDATGAVDLDGILAAIRGLIADTVSRAVPRLVAARIQVNGASRADAALRRAPDLRGKIMEEAAAAGAGENFWLEKLVINTKPQTVPAPASPMEALLRDHIDAAPGEASLEAAREWARNVWEKFPPLRASLDEAHPLAKLSRGQVDDEILSEARALLLARLGA